MKVKTIKGFHDILPENSRTWQFIESTARNIFEHYGFSEIRIPALEFTEIFLKSIGDTSDIVTKEMYTFEDRDGSSITLRPEGTAGVVRSFIEHSYHVKSPISKFYYLGTMFRHERPQKGRYRGFNQIGAEMFGTSKPSSDADIISMLWQVVESLGFKSSIMLELNFIGNKNTRKKYISSFRKFLSPVKDKLCKDCQNKFNTNPLRILDCKNENCIDLTSNSPIILDFLSSEEERNFNELQNYLNLFSIPYSINPRLVRGLDYYTNTVFELTTDALGSQNSIAAGGRYDDLVELFGGPSTPAIGFAIGIERLILLYEKIDENKLHRNKIIYVSWIGSNTFEIAFLLSNKLRRKGVNTEIDYNSRSLKSQLKRANKVNAQYSIIVGEDEIKNNIIKLRDMESGVETEFENNESTVDSIIEHTNN